ncbi:UNVERIFIED_CONTAM: hypothetical protein PYX00_000165 [Menopon gallinae]|uniref:Uncharacterized protein n=1 Tax=Menopon gallinae TaxID=328185 RepID=A0AAW2I8Q9_9NEOP
MDRHEKRYRSENIRERDLHGNCDILGYGDIQPRQRLKSHRDPDYNSSSTSISPSKSDTSTDDEVQKSSKKENKTNVNYGRYVILALVFCGLLVLSYLNINSDSLSGDKHKIDLKSELLIMKGKYPAQSAELWQNVWKVTNSTDSIQSLIILYKTDSLSAECLARDIGRLISKIHNNVNTLTLYKSMNTSDYGQELKHYYDVLRRSKHLVVPDLQTVPGETARMFHALCEDIKENIPSYFIFTLQDKTLGKNTHSRAGAMLRTSWSTLPENELYPLLSRVIKNVVEMIPENVTC